MYLHTLYKWAFLGGTCINNLKVQSKVYIAKRCSVEHVETGWGHCYDGAHLLYQWCLLPRTLVITCMWIKKVSQICISTTNMYVSKIKFLQQNVDIHWYMYMYDMTGGTVQNHRRVKEYTLFMLQTANMPFYLVMLTRYSCNETQCLTCKQVCFLLYIGTCRPYPVLS